MPKKTTTQDKSADLLHQCQRDINEAGKNINAVQKAADAQNRYNRIEIGLYLLIARSVYKVNNDGSRGNQHVSAMCSSAHGSTNSESDTYENPLSFEHFLTSIQWLARRTAYAYIKAAENLGLDETSTHADITKLRKNKALHNLTAKEWTKLCGTSAKKEQPTPQEPDKPQGVFSFYKTALVGITEQAKTLSTIRGNLDATAYSTACAVLMKELESLTGQSWEPNTQDYCPNHYKTLWPDADLESLGI